MELLYFYYVQMCESHDCWEPVTYEEWVQHWYKSDLI